MPRGCEVGLTEQVRCLRSFGSIHAIWHQQSSHGRGKVNQRDSPEACGSIKRVAGYTFQSLFRGGGNSDVTELVKDRKSLMKDFRVYLSLTMCKRVDSTNILQLGHLMS